MPSIESTTSQVTTAEPLRFPSVARDHILHCSYDYWFPKYRTSCIRSRIIPLTPDFVSYLHEDGIILADEGEPKTDDDTAASDDDDWEPSFPTSAHPPPRPDNDDDDVSDSDSDTDEPRPARQPPDVRFPSLHAEITAAIASLGGSVAPKLNWSSPKDATWISRHPNTMKCTSANDIYILLKSSSFISHDLDHAFDSTQPPVTNHNSNNNKNGNPPEFKPVLVLRTFFNPLPSLEFRCFVKSRSLIAISQRDLNYYAFLDALRPQIARRVAELFHGKLRLTFPDGDFVFDVYIPEAGYDADESDDDEEEDGTEGDREGGQKKVLGRARLIDINPWAERTDSLLFDWGELLDWQVTNPLLGFVGGDGEEQEAEEGSVASTEGTEDTEEEGGAEEDQKPEIRLIEHDDPAAYNFSSPQYSAHKLPRDVVDASMAGQGGIREFAQRWQRITEGRERQ